MSCSCPAVLSCDHVFAENCASWCLYQCLTCCGVQYTWRVWLAWPWGPLFAGKEHAHAESPRRSDRRRLTGPRLTACVPCTASQPIIPIRNRVLFPFATLRLTLGASQAREPCVLAHGSRRVCHYSPPGPQAARLRSAWCGKSSAGRTARRGARALLVRRSRVGHPTCDACLRPTDAVVVATCAGIVSVRDTASVGSDFARTEGDESSRGTAAGAETESNEELYGTGCLARVIKLTSIKKGDTQLYSMWVEGLARISVIRYVKTSPFRVAVVTKLPNGAVRTAAVEVSCSRGRHSALRRCKVTAPPDRANSCVRRQRRLTSAGSELSCWRR